MAVSSNDPDDSPSTVGDRATAGGATVGIVVVSHSRALARAAIALASEMLHGGAIRFGIAAGLDDTTFGTDAVAIKEAIEEVDGPAGVVVLMDLGSAVLSTELALDLLSDSTTRERVLLSPAPIVEGLVVAAVAAAGGADRFEVAAEARGALLGKAAHLVEPDKNNDVAAPTTADVTAVFTVTNKHGLHARPAARLVGELRGLDATVTLRNATTGAGPVPGSSLSRVATLAVLCGHDVEVSASGPQAHDAVEHLVALARRRFDEPDEVTSASAPDASGAANRGPRPASPGIAIGPARTFTPPAIPEPVHDDNATQDPDVEWRRVVGAITSVRRDIERLRGLAARDIGATDAGIFDAHLMLLGDTSMLADVKAAIVGGATATAAWRSTVAAVETEWAALPDAYLRARASDVRAIGDDVLRAMTGASRATITERGILVAADLTPADAAQLDRDLIIGIVLAHGSPSSHAAILARSRGIPAIVGAGADILAVHDGTVLALDGSSGELAIDPDADTLARFQAGVAQHAKARARDLSMANEPAFTRDGVHVEIAANIGSVADARAALEGGADAAGLVRTEFLFLGRDHAPSVIEQEAEYLALASAIGGRRITLRTLDVGGDKPLPYVYAPPEDNPFLGRRGIRLALEEHVLLVEQLDAICRTARTTPTSVMFPMVSTVQELLDAIDVLHDAAGPDGLPHDLRIGMMVEVPAAALKIETFLSHLDFVSIGTNDLTQYTLAAERGNPSVAALSDALDPGVLQLIAHTCAAATGRVPVAVCGEAGSDPAAVAILLGLGVRELSVAPAAVAAIKTLVRSLDLTQCVTLAEKALTLRNADDVRQLVSAELGLKG
jgi:phosphoenolpyruvate-protein phosphotransferase/dihydroxyacetone kinase phosphotransfer subunit